MALAVSARAFCLEWSRPRAATLSCFVVSRVSCVVLPSAYRYMTMTTIQEVAKALGLSTRAVYRRLDAFNGKLDRYLTRGINNEILFNSSALALLRRLEDLRTAERIPIRQAVARVSEEVDGKGVRPVREGNGKLIDVLEREIERLQSENVRLWGLIDTITPRLALPRSRRWLFWKRQ